MNDLVSKLPAIPPPDPLSRFRPIAGDMVLFEGPQDEFLAHLATMGEPSPREEYLRGRQCLRLHGGAIVAAFPNGIVIGTAEAVCGMIDRAEVESDAPDQSVK